MPRTCDPHRPAPQNRRTPGGGLCRPFGPHSGGVHPPDGRKQRLRPLALSAGGTRRRTRRSDHRTRHYGKKRLRHRRRRPDNGASCSASWDSSVRQTPFPPTATSSISATRKKVRLRTSELALHEGQQFAAPTRTLPREDPSIGETTPSANQRAYAEDAKQLIR